MEQTARFLYVHKGDSAAPAAGPFLYGQKGTKEPPGACSGEHRSGAPSRRAPGPRLRGPLLGGPAKFPARGDWSGCLNSRRATGPCAGWKLTSECGSAAAPPLAELALPVQNSLPSFGRGAVKNRRGGACPSRRFLTYAVGAAHRAARPCPHLWIEQAERTARFLYTYKRDSAAPAAGPFLYGQKGTKEPPGACSGEHCSGAPSRRAPGPHLQGPLLRGPAKFPARRDLSDLLPFNPGPLGP